MIPSPDQVATEPKAASQEAEASSQAASDAAGTTASSNTAERAAGPAGDGGREQRPKGEGTKGDGPKDDGPKDERPKDPPPPGFLFYTVFSFLCIAVGVWLTFAWTGYKEKYSQQTEGWHLGGTKMIEITLIRDDKKNLACASDRFFDGVHCGFRANGVPYGTTPDEDAKVLQPFNTIKNELFLAAGLWQSPILQGTLPAERFTVVCNYHVIGVLKAVSLRWSPTGTFNPVDQSVAVGTVSDCVIPQ